MKEENIIFSLQLIVAVMPGLLFWLATIKVSKIFLLGSIPYTIYLFIAGVNSFKDRSDKLK